MKLLTRYKRPLNNKTPKWFNEWYLLEFVPYKIRMDLLLVLSGGIFIGIIVNLVKGG